MSHFFTEWGASYGIWVTFTLSTIILNASTRHQTRAPTGDPSSGSFVFQGLVLSPPSPSPFCLSVSETGLLTLSSPLRPPPLLPTPRARL